jgi:hypothetical protein
VNTNQHAIAIGRVVRGAIATAGLTYESYVEIDTDMSVSTLSRRINGAIPFTYPELVRVAEILDVPLSSLIAAAEHAAKRSAA